MSLSVSRFFSILTYVLSSMIYSFSLETLGVFVLFSSTVPWSPSSFQFQHGLSWPWTPDPMPPPPRAGITDVCTPCLAKISYHYVDSWYSLDACTSLSRTFSHAYFCIENFIQDEFHEELATQSKRHIDTRHGGPWATTHSVLTSEGRKENIFYGNINRN